METIDRLAQFAAAAESLSPAYVAAAALACLALGLAARCVAAYAARLRRAEAARRRRSYLATTALPPALAARAWEASERTYSFHGTKVSPPNRDR